MAPLVLMTAVLAGCATTPGENPKEAPASTIAADPALVPVA